MTNIQQARKYLKQQGFLFNDNLPCFIRHLNLKWNKYTVQCNDEIELINFAYLTYIDEHLQQIGKLRINLENDNQCIVQQPDNNSFPFALFQRRCGYMYGSNRLIWGQRKHYLKTVLEDITNEHLFYVELEKIGMKVSKGNRIGFGEGKIAVEFSCYKTLTADFSFDPQKMHVRYMSPNYRTVVNIPGQPSNELPGLVSLERINQLKLIL